MGRGPGVNGEKTTDMVLTKFEQFTASGLLICFALSLLSAHCDEEGENAKPLRISGCLFLAIRENRGLKDTQAQLIRAQTEGNVSKSAFHVKVEPSVDVGRRSTGGNIQDESEQNYSVNVSKLWRYGTLTSVTPSYRSNDEDDIEVTFSLSQPLLRGAGTTVVLHPLYEARRNTISQLRFLETAKEQLVLDVVVTFYQIIRLEREVELHESSAVRMEKSVVSAQARQKRDMASEQDVLRAQIQLAQTLDVLEGAREGLQNTKDRLKSMLALPSDFDLKIEDSLEHGPIEIDPQEALDHALAYRLELREAWDRIADARRRVSVARNSMWPTVNLLLEASTPIGHNAGDFSWFAGVGGTSTIDRARERADLVGAQIDQEIAKRSFTLTRDNVIIQVRDVISSLNKSRVRISIQRRNVEQSRRSVQLASLRFERGMVDNLELIRAEEDLLRAELDRLSAITDYIVAQYRLKAATGTLFDRPAELLRTEEPYHGD